MMKKSKKKLTLKDNLTTLRKSTDDEITVVLYSELAKVSVTKYLLKHLTSTRRQYLYIVASDFVYNNKQHRGVTSMKGQRKAFKHAEEIFTQRNDYMKKHNYILEKKVSSI